MALNPKIVAYLDQLQGLGLWGECRAEVVESLIRSGVERVWHIIHPEPIVNLSDAPSSEGGK